MREISIWHERIRAEHFTDVQKHASTKHAQHIVRITAFSLIMKLMHQVVTRVEKAPAKALAPLSLQLLADVLLPVLPKPCRI